MSFIILMAAARAAEEEEEKKRENELKKIKKLESYLTEGLSNIPKYLLSYNGELTNELNKLLETIEKLPEEERSKIVTERITNLNNTYKAREKTLNELEWGWDYHETKLDRAIRGNGIKLKLLSQKDAKELFNLLQSNKDRLQNDVGSSLLPATIEETNTYISVINNLFRNNNGYEYGVYTEWDKLIGEVSLVPLDKKIYEIGFRIGKAHANNGYITKAVEELKKIAFTKLDAKFIVINTRKDNNAANAVAKKTGFIMEEQQINNEPDKHTRSKSNSSILRNLLLGHKTISDTKEKEYKNL